MIDLFYDGTAPRDAASDAMALNADPMRNALKTQSFSVDRGGTDLLLPPEHRRATPLHLESVAESEDTPLEDQWRVFVYSFSVSSAITLSQYFLPIFHNAPVFGNAASRYLWNIDFC